MVFAVGYALTGGSGSLFHGGSCLHRTLPNLVLALLTVSLASNAVGEDRPTPHFRRPELVAIAWHNTASLRRPQTWRPDGDLIDGDESAWIADDVHRIQRYSSISFDQLHQLTVVFRIDETAVASQVIRCRVRQEGRPHAWGTGSPSTRNFLAKSTLTTSKERLPKWPPHLDIEAMIPDGEPEVIKKLDGPPDRPIELAPGLEWSVGLRSRVDLGLKGDPMKDVPCCLLRTDSSLRPQLDEYQFEIKLRDGTWVPWRSARRVDESPTVYWTVSEPLSDANPITGITITRLKRRIEIYEKVPLRLDLEPRDPVRPLNVPAMLRGM